MVGLWLGHEILDFKKYIHILELEMGFEVFKQPILKSLPILLSFGGRTS
jgi:hypothetical protein